MTTLCLLSAVLLGQAAPEFPRTALKPAVEAAKGNDRLIVAEFWTFRSEPSRSYSKKVLSKAPVMSWISKHAVGARVNIDFNKKFRTHFNVADVPTLLVLDSKLVRWGRISGALKPEETVKQLEAARKAREAFKKGDPKALVEGYIRNEDIAKAEAALTKLWEVDTASHETFVFRMAQVLESQKDDSGALRLYQDAAEWALKGEREIRAKAMVHLATLMLRTDQPQKAIRILKKLLDESDRFPERSQVLFVLGETYLTRMEDDEKAKLYLTKVTAGYADRFAQAAEQLLKYIDMREKGHVR